MFHWKGIHFTADIFSGAFLCSYNSDLDKATRIPKIAHTHTPCHPPMEFNGYMDNIKDIQTFQLL